MKLTSPVLVSMLNNAASVPPRLQVKLVVPSGSLATAWYTVSVLFSGTVAVSPEVIVSNGAPCTVKGRVAASLMKPVPASVWVALMVSAPSWKPARSLGVMLMDQLPEPSTRAVEPAAGTQPLEKKRLMVAPGTPVPLMLKALRDSPVSTLSSPVIALIVGSGAKSSLRMVPLAVPVVMVAPLGLLRVMVKPSSLSPTVSPRT